MKVLFLKGKSKEKQVQAGFWASFVCKENTDNIILQITGRTWYRVYCNGEYVLYGPVRCAHGYARLDEVVLNDFVHEGENLLFIEMAGMNSGSQDNTGENSFLYACVKQDDQEICSLEDFRGKFIKQRASGVERFSHARDFNERWLLDEAYENYRKKIPDNCESIEQFDLDITLLPREVPQWDTDCVTDPVWTGAFSVECNPGKIAPPFSYEDKTLYRDGEHPSIEAYGDVCTAFDGTVAKDQLIFSSDHAFAIDFDFREGYAGFVGVEFSIDCDGVMDLLHADRHTDGSFASREDPQYALLFHNLYAH